MQKNHERVSHYLEYEKEFNLQGIQFPMALKHIPNFERLNNVSISVYDVSSCWRSRRIYMPFKSVKGTDDDTSHYCSIYICVL